MYESTFDFKSRPFASTPQVDRYFPASGIEQSRITLARTIERAEGPGFLVGPAGTGKSLVCQLLAEQFRGEYVVALLSTAQLTSSRALLQNVLFELGLPYHDGDDSDLRLRLTDYLEPSAQCPSGMVLLIDEAHMLPLAVLEEVRMLTNLARKGEPRVRLILAGGPEMEEQFTSPKLESFSQRIAARCYLRSLNREETTAYINHQVSTAGGNAKSVFSPEAVAAVYTATDGIPRLINQVCDHALMLASLGGHSSISEDAVEEAWSDLQQLPAPWRREEAPQSVIEFGSLTADDDATDIEDPVAAIEVIQHQIQSVAGTVELISGDEPVEPTHELVETPVVETPVEAVVETTVEAIEETEVTPAAPAPATCVKAFTEAYDEEEVIIDHYSVMSRQPHDEETAATVVEATTAMLDVQSGDVEVKVDEPEDATCAATEVDEAPVAEEPAEETVAEEPAEETPTLSVCNVSEICEEHTVEHKTTTSLEYTLDEAEPATCELTGEHAAEEDLSQQACEEAALEDDGETDTNTVELTEGFPVIGIVSDEGEAELLNPADDPVMPEYAPNGGPENDDQDDKHNVTVEPERSTGSHQTDVEAIALSGATTLDPQALAGDATSFPLPAHDDRDLIVVDEEDVSSSTPPAFRGRARRQEYAQLFAKLRRG